MKQQNVTPQLILASASPRRRELLQRIGVAFVVIPSHTPEIAQPGELPQAYALRLADEKARGVARKHPGAWVLGADTIVEIDGEVLGKPRDVADGQQMLRQLSGCTHQVMTAFALLDGAGQVRIRQVVTSRVTFKPLTEAQIQAYLATGEPFDKAGAYAVQGLGASLVACVEGSYTNVVGLPMDEVQAALRAVGLLNHQEARKEC
ncbi:MAG TPA: Maf family protein [Candidatus Binatia bacterium]|jgi:septum formation protein|nr:Maf family protein [Candidatus Binatia bacterium]